MKKVFYLALILMAWQTASAQLTLVKDIYPGNSSSSPSGFCPMNGKMYFSASTYDSAIGLPGHTERELWVSDGTNAGTYKVYDQTGSFGTTVNPAAMVSVNNNLFFIGNYSGGTQLWTSDGTSTGTKTVVTSGYPNAFPGGQTSGLMPYNGKVICVAAETSNFTKGLYQSDGTTAGTGKLQGCKLPSGSVTWVTMGGTLYMMLGLTNNYGLSRTDGTVAGTTQVVAFNSYPLSNPVVLNNTLYFIGDTSGWNHELWKSNGTKAGTVRVKDINPGTNGCNTALTPLITAGGRMFFWADNGTSGTELWSSDGTEAGTTLVKDFNPGSGSTNYFSNLMMPVNNRVVFSFQDPNTSLSSLWSSDGTTAGTIKLLDSVAGPTPYGMNYTIIGNELIFSENKKLYATDGTVAGTHLIASFPDNSLSYMSDVAYVNNLIFVTATDTASGSELYKMNYSGPNGLENIAESSNRFTLYPNPAFSELTILHPEMNTPFELTITDQAGKTRMKKSHIMPGETISLQEMKAGLYFYTIHTREAQIFSGKFIVTTTP